MTHVFDSNKHIKVYHFFWYFTMTPTKYNHFLFNYLCIFFRVFNSEKTRLNSVCKSFMIKSPQGIISMLAGTWKFLVEPSSILLGVCNKYASSASLALWNHEYNNCPQKVCFLSIASIHNDLKRDDAMLHHLNVKYLIQYQLWYNRQSGISDLKNCYFTSMHDNTFTKLKDMIVVEESVISFCAYWY